MSPSDKESPHIKALREFLTPERLALVKRDPERLALVREIGKLLATNPTFMKNLEAVASKHEAEFEKLLSPDDLKSFGWEAPELKLRRPSPAAAAAAAAVLAAAVPVPA